MSWRKKKGSLVQERSHAYQTYTQGADCVPVTAVLCLVLAWKVVVDCRLTVQELGVAFPDAGQAGKSRKARSK